jgi:hypothetical protein
LSWHGWNEERSGFGFAEAALSSRVGKGLWLLAGLVALVLLAATIGLVARTRTQAIVGETVFLVSRGGAVKVYRAPSLDAENSAALVRGSEVLVVGLSKQEDQTWYLVQKGEMPPGWVPGSDISRDPP